MEIEDACRPYARKPQREWRKPAPTPRAWRPEPSRAPSPDTWIKAVRSTSREGVSRQSSDHALEQEFERLRGIWKRETMNLSDPGQIVMHEAYQRIIGMGPSGLPLIFRALRDELDLWFPALRAITGENPVAASDRGDMEAMQRTWIDWALKNGHL